MQYWIYAVVVFAAVILTSTLLMVLLHKKNLLSFPVFISIAAGSVAVSLIFPLSSYGFLRVADFLPENLRTILAVLMAMLLHIGLILVLAIVISSRLTGHKSEALADGSGDKVQDEGSIVNEYDTKTINILEDIMEGKNILEKSVDSVDFTDKMGVEESTFFEAVETFEKTAEETAEVALEEPLKETVEVVLEDSLEETLEVALEDSLEETAEENMTDVERPKDIGGFVDEAFRLKLDGDLEGAILYYMYALDLKPDKDMVFWVVLDICALYKTLGQIELARDILETYVSKLGDVMDASVKREIERNLAYT